MGPRAAVPEPAPARHELPEIDAAALTTARAIDRLLAAADELVGDGHRVGEPEPRSLDAARHAAAAERWAGYFQRLPDQLRDDPFPELRGIARRARAAYGPKDSIRDVFAPDVTEPLLDAIDRLLKAIARYELNRR